ncbi:DNA polymerase III subunit [Defluviitalea phaphyphila]|uniref:DNA polymerase III subunit n=1 Tax=Defluviitalea phaphyphila TaxID=1473580 RepID=UPI000730AC2A|nr:DNA polymerase III subunit delta' C-terminal domain-containing protein [Defluviitalea phaphyphila]
MYTFEEIIGHKEIIENLKRRIKYKKVSHSYIFDGIEGIGKKTIAKTYAKTLQCLKGGVTPCNECSSCRAFDSGNHPDVFFIDTDKKSLGVDDIRNSIQKDIETKPYKYKYKIYIIEKADKMTIQAQNALLKTIEEPPSYGIIILLSNNFKQFLPTIISRCSILKLNPLKPKEIKKYFNNIDKNIDLYIAFSGGSIGIVKNMLESNKFLDIREKMIEWIYKIQEDDLINLFEIQKEMEIYKEDIDIVLDLMYIWYRDILFIKEIGNNEYIINKDKINELLNMSMNLSYNKISKSLEAIANTKIYLKQNANFRLALEIMLLNIKENIHG